MAKSNVGKKPISEEEYTTNKVLTVFSVCLLGVLVLMVLQRLLNYGSTWAAGMAAVRVLLGVGAAAAVCGVVMLGQERAGARQAARRILCGRNVLIAGLFLALCMWAISYVGSAPIKALYVVLPVLAVYYLVYHSYTAEFFIIAADAGAGLGLMWLTHRALSSANYGWVAAAAAAAAAVLTAVQLLCVWLRRGKGKSAPFGRGARVMLTVSPLLMTALTAAVLLAPSRVLFAMGAAAAYLFVTAVYYTVKLM